MQILLVAFSRRMCCSRVCKERRIAGVPASSTLTPTRRPGIERSKPARTPMNPACGPPNPIGTPKRWAEPTTTSAPSEPGDLRRVSASKSAATIAIPPAACISAISEEISRTSPEEAGYEIKSPNAPASDSPRRHVCTLILSGFARVCTTARVCG
ncbi:unannotated protein [freshwater metagenome]|uniref:Unannotated protein n=1 Tax=freshwater metagenome TaxID=449393 RepID=A0A6J7BK75_9ZZZZ